MRRLRVNRQIRAQNVRLIDENDEQMGVLPVEQALKLAQEREYDLVEMAPNANPPVCRLMDYGKYLYRLEKQERKHKVTQQKSEVKGLRFGVRTGRHDLEVKANYARKFLTEKNRVKVSLMFRGREITHQDLGYQQMNLFAELLKDIAMIEEGPKRQGNTLMMILKPLI